MFISVFVSIAMIFSMPSGNLCRASGSFDGHVGSMYRFVSDDGTVNWLLSEPEIGFVPDMSCSYELFYDDNGTDSCTMHEETCECYVYDDRFVYICRVNKQE